MNEPRKRDPLPVYSHRCAVAPMMDWTDRHCRFLLRQVSRHTVLYTEMVTTAALLHGDAPRHLQHDDCEHPVALQLGGSEPSELAACSRLGAEAGFDEINLNVGCPSDRVQSGRFGACLMAEPRRVADCVAAMQDTVEVPVTVKTRIGIDHQDSYEFLTDFVGQLQAAGCMTLVVHARKAFLKGLSPKENRSVPPLRYDTVYRLKRDFPSLRIILNGGVESLEAVKGHLEEVDGVMLGRAAYHNPYLLAAVDRELYQSSTPIPSRAQVVERMMPYIERELIGGTQLKHITRHMLGLFQGQPGARHWRRHLSEHATANGAGSEVIGQALDAMRAAASTTDKDTDDIPGGRASHG